MDTFIDKTKKKLFSISDENVINVFTDKFKRLTGKKDETNQSEDVPGRAGRSGECEDHSNETESNSSNR